MIIPISQRTSESLILRAISVFEDLVVDGRKELADVGLQDILVPASECLAPVRCGVGPFPLAAGVAVEAKRSLEDRLEDACQGVMHNPVSERGGTHLPRLALVNRERAVGTRTVGFAGELLMQPEHLALEIEEEAPDAGLEAFATSGGVRRRNRPRTRSFRPIGCLFASRLLLTLAPQPTAHQPSDLVDRLRGEGITFNLQALQVLRQPHLEPEDLEFQVCFFEQLLAILCVLGGDQRFEQSVQVSFDPFAQNEAVIARELTGVISRPENQVVSLGDHDQFLVFFIDFFQKFTYDRL